MRKAVKESWRLFAGCLDCVKGERNEYKACCGNRMWDKENVYTGNGGLIHGRL